MAAYSPGGGNFRGRHVWRGQTAGAIPQWPGCAPLDYGQFPGMRDTARAAGGCWNNSWGDTVRYLLAILLVLGFWHLAYAEEAGYDLIFKLGTLADQPEGGVLRYSRRITNGALPDPEARDRAETVTLTLAGDDKAILRTEIDGKQRPIGGFPASVGNPMAMYFMEATVRQLAEVTGGSPFYIRNRVKEALVKGTSVRNGEQDIGGAMANVHIITMRPFADSESRALMGPFGTLEMRFTVSDAVPGWYVAMIAETSSEGSKPPLYSDQILAETTE